MARFADLVFYITPHTAEDSEAVLTEAVASLGRLRLPLEWPGNSAAEIHLLTSLIAEAQLAKSVALARDQGCSWAEIGDLLGTTRAAAWQRFADHARTTKRRTKTQLAKD